MNGKYCKIKKIRQDTIINACKCKLLVILPKVQLNLNLLKRFTKDLQIQNLMKILPVLAELFCAHKPRDRQKNMMIIIVAIRNFLKILMCNSYTLLLKM